MHPESWTETYDALMPLWRHRRQFPWTYHHSCWSEAAETTGPNLPRKYEISEIQESTTTLLGNFKLLQELHPKAIGKTNTIFQIAY